MVFVRVFPIWVCDLLLWFYDFLIQVINIVTSFNELAGEYLLRKDYNLVTIITNDSIMILNF